MRAVCFLFCCCCSFFSFAQQSVALFILEENGEVAIGAQVSLVGKEKVFTTDENGLVRLSFDQPKKQVFVKYLDYPVDTFWVDVTIDKGTWTHTLSHATKAMDEVVIRAGKFDHKLEEQTVSLEVIKAETIENRNTRSIETALDQTPGLNILDGEPQIRGGSGFTFGVGSKVAVMVDDMPMLSGDAGRPEWGFIPVENIHQVEVIKGAASVLSGASALSGSINIRTAYPSTIPLNKVIVYSGAYSDPLKNAENWYSQTPLISGINLLHSHKKGNWDIVLGGNINYDRGFIGPPKTDSLVVKDTISNFQPTDMYSKRARANFNVSYRFKQVKGLQVGLNGNGMLAQTNMVFAWLNDSSGLYNAYPGAVFLQQQTIGNLDPFIVFSGKKWKHSLRSRGLRTLNDMSANQSNQSTVLYSDYQVKASFFDTLPIEVVAGATFQKTYSYANIYAGSGTPYNMLQNASLYVQTEKKITKRWLLSLGARGEYFDLNTSIFAFQPIVRAGTNLQLGEATFLRGSYGQGYRFPTITERFIKTGVGNFGVFPNPNLLPEYSWNGEIGLKQGFKLGSWMGFLDVAAFYQRYQNTIEYMFGIWDITNPSSFAGFKFLNTGNSQVKGIDASIMGKGKTGKKDEWTFLVGYNYLLPQTLSPDYVYAIDDFNRKFSYNSTSLDSSSRVLKYRFLHNIKADVSYAYNDKWTIGLTVKYFSKIINMDRIIKEFEEFTAQAPYIQDIRYMDYFEANRKGNIVFDGRLAYNIHPNHKVAVITTNLLNRSYSLRPLKIEAPRTIMVQYSFVMGRK